MTKNRILRIFFIKINNKFKRRLSKIVDDIFLIKSEFSFENIR